MIKRIFSDMDGALLNSKGWVSDSNAQKIRQAGLPVTLVSARAPMEMRQAIDALGLDGVQVGFNGGLIYQLIDGAVKPLHTEIIKKATAQHLLQTVRQHFSSVSLSYYDLNRWYCDKIDDGIRYETSITLQDPTILTESVFLEGKTYTFKIMMITFDEATMVEMEAYLQSLELDGVTIQRSGPFHLEITHSRAKKSKGIAFIMQKEGLRKETTAAFGDGHNDIPMLEMVGYPIVMANAFDDIKSLAYKVTKSNDQDGVGYGIENYLINL